MTKPRLLQINPVVRLSTSTGRIMREIGEMVTDCDWESYVAYSRGRDGLMECSSKTIPVGNKYDVALHGILTRLTDRHGLGSAAATREFIRQIDAVDPDIVHIHNIHGYFLNYKLLFEYLSKHNKKVIWTVHDCWLYTGHCYHYSAAGCQRWQTGCGSCPQRSAFPRSWFIDRSAHNFTDKQKAFTSLKHDNFVIVTVSDWIRREMQRSFLKDCNFKVIHNGIDLDVFKPSADGDTAAKYGLSGKTIYLGVASIWLKEKGLGDFARIAEKLHDGEAIVLVGKLPSGTVLPKGITHICRTDNVGELADLYSAATVFINPTWQDNYPTVNLESQACGTPVVTYRTGGSPESLTPATGYVAEQGDTDSLLAAARRFAAGDRRLTADLCRTHAERNFAKRERYADYLDLYKSMLVNK